MRLGGGVRGVQAEEVGLGAGVRWWGWMEEPERLDPTTEEEEEEPASLHRWLRKRRRRAEVSRS